MKHLAKSNRKLNRTSSHRKSLLSNLAGSLIINGRIQTTLPKAKTLRPVVEKLVTLGKNNDFNTRKRILSKVRNIDVLNKLCKEVSPKFLKRNGGYTRILKTGFRYGDAAPMAIIEFVE